ncbi:hypothetical protein FGRMN_11232 [Fusarium graminum]|nr:hypothetical protein FGRMN_11232 [Fusarium graminum]
MAGIPPSWNPKLLKKCGYESWEEVAESAERGLALRRETFGMPYEQAKAYIRAKTVQEAADREAMKQQAIESKSTKSDEKATETEAAVVSNESQPENVTKENETGDQRAGGDNPSTGEKVTKRRKKDTV